MLGISRKTYTRMATADKFTKREYLRLMKYITYSLDMTTPAEYTSIMAALKERADYFNTKEWRKKYVK
jgi:hypothetical protein